MVTAIRKEGESFESLFKRFRKKVQQEKVLSEFRHHRFYEKPSQIRKRKAAKKLSKSRKTTRKMQRRGR
jgi:small subunit ribosomal protein S21